MVVTETLYVTYMYRDAVSHKALAIYYLAFNRKCFPTPETQSEASKWLQKHLDSSLMKAQEAYSVFEFLKQPLKPTSEQ